MKQKDCRISTRREFIKILKKGKLFENNYYKLYISKGEQLKFAIVVSKKIGKATERNKIKRRIREIIWNRGLRDKKLNLIFIIKAGIKELEFDKLEHIIKSDINRYEENFN